MGIASPAPLASCAPMSAPPPALNGEAAVPPDPRTLAELYHGAGDDPATIALRLDVREATVRRWLGLPPRGAPARPTQARPDAYAAGPVTERARRVWAAWQATPDAGTMEIARRAGVSPAYASRLIGHWKAQEQNDARDAA